LVELHAGAESVYHLSRLLLSDRLRNAATETEAGPCRYRAELVRRVAEAFATASGATAAGGRGPARDRAVVLAHGGADLVGCVVVHCGPGHRHLAIPSKGGY